MDPITIAMGLAQFVPALVKWVSGSDKAEEVAQKAIDVAKAVTGTGTGEAALAELKVNPDLVMQYRTKMLEQEEAFEQMYLADRQDARKRDTAFIAAGKYNWRADILAFLAVGGMITCVYFIARDINLPERAVNAIMFIAGVLASAVRDVYGFEFGSSRGSKEAQGTLSDMLKGRRG